MRASKRYFTCLITIVLSLPVVSFAEETGHTLVSTVTTTTTTLSSTTKENPKRSSTEIVRLAWKASQEDDYKTLDLLVSEMLQSYEAKAKSQALQLTAFPARDVVENYVTMNDVATILFIKGEALHNQGKIPEAKETFDAVIKNYPWAQSWDPSRGSYWSVREKSQATKDRGEGKEVIVDVERNIPSTKVTLAFPGKHKVVNYTQFGEFLNVGTKDYHYQVNDRKGLSAAVGEGIYPNLTDIYKDPGYKKALKEGRLKGSHWDFVNSPDLQAAFYKWATITEEPWGTKLFYMGKFLEKSKLYYEAIKCYQALIVFYPETQAWTYWHTPWYPAQAAIAKIQHIIRMHPELNLEMKGSKILIQNSFDNDPANDITITSPGEIKQLSMVDRTKRALNIEKMKVPLGNVVKTLGQGTVQLAKYENGHWQVLVNQKPFFIKGVTYGPTKVGQTPDKGTLSNWMTDDFNKNDRIDGPYDAWMDRNLNNKQDANEPTVGDFALMKEMGMNTLRIYDHPQRPIDKKLLRAMYQEHGFMVIMGNLFGKYAVGSGAAWSEGTDYENPVHRKNMLESVKNLVMEFKDEPYVLMWLLGNENNYGVASNADKKPEAYYRFVNEAALMIKSIDPNHPVAMCNGDILFLDIFGKYAPDVDAYGANLYRGDYGFGSYWQQVKEVTDKPTFITEYGAPAYSGTGMSLAESLIEQAAYHKGNWLDIYYNSAGFNDGDGNSIGGVAFEWLDEWWKNYEPSIHDTKADVVGPFPGGYYYEEWFGLLGQGDGKSSPYLREPRKVFYTYKSLWNSKD